MEIILYWQGIQAYFCKLKELYKVEKAFCDRVGALGLTSRKTEVY